MNNMLLKKLYNALSELLSSLEGEENHRAVFEKRLFQNNNRVSIGHGTEDFLQKEISDEFEFQRRPVVHQKVKKAPTPHKISVQILSAFHEAAERANAAYEAFTGLDAENVGEMIIAPARNLLAILPLSNQPFHEWFEENALSFFLKLETKVPLPVMLKCADQAHFQALIKPNLDAMIYGDCEIANFQAQPVNCADRHNTELFDTSYARSACLRTNYNATVFPGYTQCIACPGWKAFYDKIDAQTRQIFGWRALYSALIALNVPAKALELFEQQYLKLRYDADEVKDQALSYHIPLILCSDITQLPKMPGYAPGEWLF